MSITPREAWHEALRHDPWTTFQSSPAGRPVVGGHRAARGRTGHMREAGTELEALQSSTAQVRDLVLESADVPSSLVVSLSSTVELLDGRMDTAAANRVF
jgi:hypothetical protein